MKIRFDKSRAVFARYSAYEKYLADNKGCAKELDDEDVYWCVGDCGGGEDCLPVEAQDPDNGGSIWWCQCDRPSTRKKLYEEGLIQARELLSPEDFEKYTQRMAEEFSD